MATIFRKVHKRLETRLRGPESRNLELPEPGGIVEEIRVMVYLQSVVVPSERFCGKTAI